MLIVHTGFGIEALTFFFSFLSKNTSHGDSDHAVDRCEDPFVKP
jgi:hypothetical protein